MTGGLFSRQCPDSRATQQIEIHLQPLVPPPVANDAANRGILICTEPYPFAVLVAASHRFDGKLAFMQTHD